MIQLSRVISFGKANKLCIQEKLNAISSWIPEKASAPLNPQEEKGKMVPSWPS